jgi:hypothetical protein
MATHGVCPIKGEHGFSKPINVFWDMNYNTTLTLETG